MDCRQVVNVFLAHFTKTHKLIFVLCSPSSSYPLSIDGLFVWQLIVGVVGNLCGYLITENPPLSPGAVAANTRRNKHYSCCMAWVYTWSYLLESIWYAFIHVKRDVIPLHSQPCMCEFLRPVTNRLKVALLHVHICPAFHFTINFQ